MKNKYLYSILIIILFLPVCKKNSAEIKVKKNTENEIIIPVRVSEVRKNNSGKTINSVGSFFPFEEVKLSGVLGGIIKEINVNEGDAVKAGMVLAAIDDQDYVLQVKLARDNLEEANARLARLEAGARDQEIKVAESQVSLNKANLENAQSDLKRKEDLYKKNSLPLLDLERARTIFAVNQATLKSSQEQLALLREGATKEDLDATKAHINALNSSLEMARKKLLDTKIISPIAGVVSRKMVSLGEFVGVGVPLFTVINIEKLKFTTLVPEMEIGEIGLGQEIQIEVDAFPGQVFKGKLNLINPEVDSVTRTVSIEANISNKDRLLKSGLLGRAIIQGKKKSSMLVVSREAVPSDEMKQNVFVPEGEKAKMKTITIGRIFPDEVEIISGLREGEKVLFSPDHKLSDGDRIILLSKQE